MVFLSQLILILVYLLIRLMFCIRGCSNRSIRSSFPFSKKRGVSNIRFEKADSMKPVDPGSSVGTS